MDEITFQDELNLPTINLPRAAFRLARSFAYPALNVEGYMARLNHLADSVREQVSACKTPDDRLDCLSDFLFFQSNFRGNTSDYTDPENSFLNRVLDRRLGIPITLSLIYIAVAKRLGIPAYGIGLPGHFIVGVFENGSETLIDPFNAGERLTRADAARLVKDSTGYTGGFQMKWLSPIPPAAVLARLLSNLTNAYVTREDWQAAIPVLQHLLLLQPETSYHLRDLGYLYMYSGSMRLSAQYLEEYLRRTPSAADFENVRSSLQIVAGRLALWN